MEKQQGGKAAVFRSTLPFFYLRAHLVSLASSALAVVTEDYHRAVWQSTHCVGMLNFAPRNEGCKSSSSFTLRMTRSTSAFPLYHFPLMSEPEGKSRVRLRHRGGELNKCLLKIQLSTEVVVWNWGWASPRVPLSLRRLKPQWLSGKKVQFLVVHNGHLRISYQEVNECGAYFRACWAQAHVWLRYCWLQSPVRHSKPSSAV